MKILKILLCCFMFVETKTSYSEIQDTITFKEAITLGTVQGITEFLPVSSTGHMILANKFVSNKQNITQSQSRTSYIILIQIGSILALMMFYRKQIACMLCEMFHKNMQGQKLLRNLIISLIPAVILGLFIHNNLEKFYSEKIIAIALLAGSFLILVAEIFYKKQKKHSLTNSIYEISTTQSITVGIFQILALVPGMSRSMATICGGYFSKMSRAVAVEYSFLLGLETMAAATLFQLATKYDIVLKTIDLKVFITGIAVTFIVSLICIKFLLTFLKKYGLIVFAIYRILLAISIVVL